MKTYTSIQLFIQGYRLLASVVDLETEKAFLVKISNGKWVGKTTNSLWIPKSILKLVSEEHIIDSSTSCPEVIKKFEVPQWFVTKNKL